MIFRVPSLGKQGVSSRRHFEGAPCGPTSLTESKLVEAPDPSGGGRCHPSYLQFRATLSSAGPPSAHTSPQGAGGLSFSKCQTPGAAAFRINRPLCLSDNNDDRDEVDRPLKATLDSPRERHKNKDISAPVYSIRGLALPRIARSVTSRYLRCRCLDGYI